MAENGFHGRTNVPERTELEGFLWLEKLAKNGQMVQNSQPLSPDVRRDDVMIETRYRFMCFTCKGHLVRLVSSSGVRVHALMCAYVNAAFAFSRILGNIAAEAYGEVRYARRALRRGGADGATGVGSRRQLARLQPPPLRVGSLRVAWSSPPLYAYSPRRERGNIRLRGNSDAGVLQRIAVRKGPVRSALLLAGDI